MRKLTVLSICVVLVFCMSFATSAEASDEEDILQLATNWTKAFKTADFELWSSLWWKSPKTSDFAPPNSSAFLTQGYDSLLNKMRSAFEYPAGTYAPTVHNPQVIMLDDNTAILPHYQIMTLNPPFVKEQIVEQQRITFVVQKIGGKWLIVHAHGSYLPTE